MGMHPQNFQAMAHAIPLRGACQDMVASMQEEHRTSDTGPDDKKPQEMKMIERVVSAGKETAEGHVQVGSGVKRPKPILAWTRWAETARSQNF